MQGVQGVQGEWEGHLDGSARLTASASGFRPRPPATMRSLEEGRSAPYVYAPIRGLGLGNGHERPEIEELRQDVRQLRGEFDALQADWQYWLPFLHHL